MDVGFNELPVAAGIPAPERLALHLREMRAMSFQVVCKILEPSDTHWVMSIRNHLHILLTHRTALIWGITGSVLIGLHLVMAALSSRFSYDRDLLAAPIPALVTIEIAAGATYLVGVWNIRRSESRRGLLAWVFIVGIFIRACALLSTPILEDDYYRYLWDGAVVAHGRNPYEFPPSEVLRSKEKAGLLPRQLTALADNSGNVLERVNHPHLSSVYPPVAQTAFALAYWIRPWSLQAWRAVLLAFDSLTLALVILALRMLGQPLLGFAVYWWNPLLVKEAFNSVHLDAIALPLVLGAVLLAVRGRALWATLTLGLAVGVKIWPLVLLPFILRPVFTQAKRLIFLLLLFTTSVFALFVPVLNAGLHSGSGFNAYFMSWEMNDALFMLVLWGVKAMPWSLFYANGSTIARILVAAIFAGWIAWRLSGRTQKHADLWENCLLAVALMFLLSPSQFPWYYIGLLPFLTVRPRFSLLLLTALLPLYYARFYLSFRQMSGVFDYGIVWLEYVPVWFFLAREWRMGSYPNAGLPLEAAA